MYFRACWFQFVSSFNFDATWSKAIAAALFDGDKRANSAGKVGPMVSILMTGQVNVPLHK